MSQYNPANATTRGKHWLQYLGTLRRLLGSPLLFCSSAGIRGIIILHTIFRVHYNAELGKYYTGRRFGVRFLLCGRIIVTASE
jgi:hypothetical protein